jgi:hypothetical protein
MNQADGILTGKQGGIMNTGKRCAACRDGEHANYDNEVYLVTVWDEETGKTYKRCYLCREHRTSYRDDGYGVSENRCSK